MTFSFTPPALPCTLHQFSSSALLLFILLTSACFRSTVAAVRHASLHNAVLPAMARPDKTPRPCKRSNAEPRYIPLFVEYDSQLCAKYGGNSDTVNSKVRAVFEQAQRPFAQQTCIRFNVSSITGHCDPNTDPYGPLDTTDTTSNEILSAFCDTWLQDNKAPKFGVALLITGFSSPDIAVGTAYVQGACRGSRPCAWIENLQRETITHELGHSFNAPHTKGPDVMAASLSDTSVFEFAQSSVDIITSFADSRLCGFRTDGSSKHQNGPDDDGGFGDDGIRISFSSVRRMIIIVAIVVAAVAVFSIINWAIRAMRRRLALQTTT